MNRRRCLMLSAAIACALGSASHADPVDVPGQIWLVTSPAECPGSGGELSRYESTVREQATATLKQLSRTPRMIDTRKHLLDALADLQSRGVHGWLLLFFSGHGEIERGTSRVCVGDDRGPGEWLDIDRELLRALPRSLSGVIIVLDACSSANVDPHLSPIPTAVISASPHIVDSSALFGSMILASLSSARDENCNGVFDDDDLFAGLTRRLRATLSMVSLEAWPKLRRNAPSPLPIPVSPTPVERCTKQKDAVAALASRTRLPQRLVEQRRLQDALARGSLALPDLDIDYFVVSGGDRSAAEQIRRLAGTAHLEELRLGASEAASLAATMTFAEVYHFELSPRWLRTWRLRDGLLLSVVRLRDADSGVPSRMVRSRTELVMRGSRPRYSHARRYLRTVNDPQGVATPCFESEGQCFVEPVDRKPAEE